MKENTPTINNRRRNILKSVAAPSVLVGSVTNPVAGSSPEPSVSQEDVSYKVEELDHKDTRRYLGQAQSEEPVREMGQYLRQEKNINVNFGKVSGVRVNPNGGKEHVVLQIPLNNSKYNNAKLHLRVFEDTATASALVGSTEYKSNPESVSISDSGVLTTTEWGKYLSKQNKSGKSAAGVRPQISTSEVSCDSSTTVSADSGLACRFVQSVAAIGSGVLLIFPEPSSSAKGAVGFSVILGGGCELHDIVTDHLAGCSDFDELTLCAEYNCRIDPISGVWCEPEIRAFPADGC